MKKLNVSIILSSVFIFLLSYIISYSTNFVTERQNYLSANDGNVSTRELAMLASLVYEDVPNDNIYKYPLTRSSKDNNGCIDSDGKLKKGCFFSQKNKMVKLKNSKENYKVKQYIEGMSERKAKSVVNVLTDAYEEDGQKYYFLNFANVSELEDSWSIFDYKSDSARKKDPDNVSWNNAFDAITFKKENNYVIAFRGTDYPDLYEWITDVLYSINGQNSQSMKAYNYAQEVYDKIIKDNSNAKIYVTGHSLGAYLAQIGGAAIVDKEASITESPETREVLNAAKLVDYNKEYNISNSHLEQVAYFNGMGVTPIFVSNKFTTNINNSLIYLSTHDKNGNVVNSDRTVNYSDDIKSSGRLVLYSITGDPISDIGFHYGEIYKVEYGADAVTNHENHSFKTLIDSAKDSVKNKISSIKDKKISDLTADDIKNLIENTNNNVKKFTEGLSKIVSLGIDLNDIVQNSKNNQSGELMPSFITNLDNNYKNYSPISNLSNILRDAKNYISKDNTSSIVSILNNNSAISAFGLLEYANVNHETDSFMCLIDSDNGQITKENIEFNVEPINMKCENNICTYDKNSSLKLSARVTGGCAKSYNFTYHYEEGSYSSSGVPRTKYEGYKNEILISSDELDAILNNNDNTSNNKVYFEVKVKFGDLYRKMKATIESSSINGSNKIVYSVKDNYQANPTLNDNFILNSRKTKGKYFTNYNGNYIQLNKNGKYIEEYSINSKTNSITFKKAN